MTGSGGYWPNDQADLRFDHDEAAMHLIAAACCVGHGQYRIDAAEPLRDKSIKPLTDALIDLGAGIGYESNTHHPPITIRATGLPGGTTRLVSHTWPLSAVLLAAPCARTDVFIELAEPAQVSQTLATMESFGVQVIADGRQCFIVPAPQPYRATTYQVAS